MITYQLHSTSQPRLLALGALPPVTDITVIKFRAVLLSKRALDADELEGIEIFASYRGDAFSTVEPWVHSNILTELSSEASKRPVSTKRQREKAIASWEAAVQAEEDSHAAVIQAARAKENAAKHLFLTMGKVPVSLFGEMHDPCYTREAVYYRKRHET